jgi:hypothetical protein
MQRRSRDDEATARVFGKRAALGLCTAVSLWFVEASVAQITPAVFGASIVPIPAGAAGSPESECARALRGGGLDGGPGVAGGPEALAHACSQAASGLDALAAFERLRLAEEQLKGSDPAAVERLRRDLSAHLPAEMR